MSKTTFWSTLLAGAVVTTLVTQPASAQKKYDPGASDTEIKIGQTMPYSGPASPYGTIGLAMAAYFEKINAEGRVNGRKITLLSRDDGFQSSKTVEMTRMLVEQDEVLFMAASLGTAPNIAVQKYLNGKKVPQLFVATGATRWNDPANFPWTMGWQPSYQIEGGILEPDPAAESAWMTHVADMAERTLFPKANSWYLGANIAGKPRIFMPYVGEGYRFKCEQIAARGYEGFRLT